MSPPSGIGTRDSLITRASRSAYYALTLKLLFQVLALTAMLLLIRVLGQAEFGAYSLLAATLPLMQLIGSFGLANVLQRFLPEYYHAQRNADADRLVRIVATARLLLTVAILAVVLFGWERIAPLVKLEPYRDQFLVFTVAILAFQQWGLFKLAIEARFGHQLTLTLQLIGAVIRCAGYALAFRSDAPLLAVIVTDSVNFIFLAASHAWLYRRMRPATDRSNRASTPAERNRLLRFGALSHFNDAGAQLLDRGIDNFLVAFFLDLPSVAVFAFCDEVSRKLSRLSPVSFFGDVVRPLVFARGAELPRPRLDAAMNMLNRANYAYFVPLFCAVALCGPELIELVFDKYGEYHAVLLTSLGFVVLNEIAYPVGLVAQLRERMDIVLWSKVFGVVNLAAALLLIPALGVLGAVLATGSSNLAKSLFIWWHLRREFSLAPSLRQALVCLAYWSVGTVVLLAITDLSGASRLSVAFVGLPVLLAGYVAWAHDPTDDERLVLLQLAARYSAFNVVLRMLGAARRIA
jgi:O-antigen/teichoic acid export membrane protein